MRVPSLNLRISDQHLPFNIGGRPFGGIVEENLVLDLQPAQLLVEEIQFFIDGSATDIPRGIA